MVDSREKPLHVRVAEALGWIALWAPNAMWPDEYWGNHPEYAPLVGQRKIVPSYDTDWSATGPLVEKYRFSVAPMGDRWRVALDVPNGHAVTDDEYLTAVCRLILSLHAAEKL